MSAAPKGTCESAGIEIFPLCAAIPRKRRRSALRFACWIPIAIWFVAVTALMAALAIGHWYALPHPDQRDAQLAAGLAELLRGRAGWATVHVLYTECRCSQRVLAHLAESERPAGVHEVVVLVGDDAAVAARLRARHYTVVPVSPQALFQRFGIEGAPLFVVVDPAREVRYIGGYTRRQQGPDIQDLSILRELQAGSHPAGLPVFGCAVSKRLQDLADPIAIKR
jgi:hypothetical protein